MKLLVINGPNINLTGTRETHIYGNTNYKEMCKTIKSEVTSWGHKIDFFQSNSEGDIIDAIHNAAVNYDGIVINPGAYTHYSLAIHDAIKAVNIPTVEVHMSNIHSREGFRRTSVTAPACIGQISGFGSYVYVLGSKALVNYMNDDKK